LATKRPGLEAPCRANPTNHENHTNKHCLKHPSNLEVLDRFHVDKRI